jgi:SAM-dependent methyltransferase
MSAFDRQKWDAKYAAAETAPREPSAVLLGLAQYLPFRGHALDVAGGAGRNAIWLAKRGLSVTITDVSPVGLALARQSAAVEQVIIDTIETDLEQSPLPNGPYDLILSVCYLWRPLFAQFPASLAPGGVLAVIQPTKKNLERNDKPPVDYLLDQGELPCLAADLEIIHFREDWLADGRHDAVLIAQKPQPHVV